ncbi:hypothetical protein ANO14919_121250 [Xylariales sp. No.14919]|nr:hypothetical protein ANO14919_121250 [Xylariales sp. No.14919]
MTTESLSTTLSPSSSTDSYVGTWFAIGDNRLCKLSRSLATAAVLPPMTTTPISNASGGGQLFLRELDPHIYSGGDEDGNTNGV